MQYNNKQHKDIYLYSRNLKKNADLSMWFYFPGPESFALSSLGYMWLYREIDMCDDIDIECVYEDTKTTRIMPNNIGLIGVSLNFDFDFLKVFEFFERNHLEFKASERKKEDPLIYAGGPVITANPETYKNIYDFMLIGDGENINLEIARIVADSRRKGLNKKEILECLSNLEVVYVPSIPKSVVKRTTRLTECVYTPIISRKAFFPNTFILEVERGCANRCAFCLASYINLPIRHANYDEIIELIDNALKYTNKIALLGAQVTAHPRFLDICKHIESKIDSGIDIKMSVSSLRVDAFVPDIVRMLVKTGQKNLTLAIEAGSERLRKVINKNLTQEQIYSAVEVAKQCGLHGIKFYGMLGIPSENKEDIDELIALAYDLKSKYKAFDFSFGFSTFVPKANTPFQWFGRDDEKSLELKANYIKKELRKIGIEVCVSSPKWDYYQAVLSRGDYKLTNYIIEVYKLGGKIGAFRKAAKNTGINTDYYAIENYPYDKNLPWDFIDIKPGKQFLISEAKNLTGN